MDAKWLRALEKRFGNIYIERFAYVLVGLKLFGLFLLAGNPGAYAQMQLIPSLVWQGEWWRLLGFLTIPSSTNPFWLFFELYLLFIFVDALEREWGAFRVNIYYLIGYVLSVGFALSSGIHLGSAAHLDRTLMLAFAALFPNFELLLFFILPVKIKWLAWLIWIGVAFQMLTSTFLFQCYLVLIYANYFLFFGPGHLRNFQTASAARRRRKKFRDTRKDDHDY